MSKYTPEQRIIAFWNKVNKDGSIPAHMPHLGKCWEWTGNVNWKGYGALAWGKNKDKAHRISWILAYGSIPNKLWVLHKCDNRRCVNPEHLFLGTAKDNVDDCIKKGRHFKKGESEVMTIEIAREIRYLYFVHKVKQREIAEKYKVSQQYISFIVNKKVYKE